MRKPLLHTTLYGLALLTIFVFSGCASKGPYRLNLMAPPDVYDQDTFNPFTEITQLKPSEEDDILYATDRLPTTQRNQSPYYKNETGEALRLGKATVKIQGKNFNWEQLRDISLLKGKRKNYPLVVDSVHEFGVLDRSMNRMIESKVSDPISPTPGKEFAAQINDKLRRSKVKDVFIYVHGYKVVFDNPLLVASELWHFLGYEGIFIAYAWPATPKVLAYIADSESAAHSSRNLRILLQFLADETDARRIHIVGYSAGTRVVTTALWQLALDNTGVERDVVRRKLRIGNVILAASDVDRTVAGGYVADGLLDVMDHLTIYVSGKDKALGFSRFLFGRERLGEYLANDEFTAQDQKLLKALSNLDIIDVSSARQSGKGNGHAYFRNSPWVSSDLLMTLRYNLRPHERALALEPNGVQWTFPDDYIPRLREAISEADPALMEHLSTSHQKRHGKSRSNPLDSTRR